MIGITADFPVREAPLITVTFPSANETRRGAKAGLRGHKMISLIWKNISEPHFESCGDFMDGKKAKPMPEFLGASHETANVVGNPGNSASFGKRYEGAGGFEAQETGR